jgi:cyclohexadieny/prephenate dehydrogenase
LFRAVGVVGVGLLGGSLALALKQRGLARTVVGIAPADHPPSIAELQTAQKLRAIDRAEVGFGPSLEAVELLLVCTPVSRIADHVRDAAKHLPREALITDVGSTKGDIVRRITDERFIGSHPMAGSERSGVEAASAQMFTGRTCILTPTEKTSPELLQRVTRFWEALGMTVLCLSPEEHDAVVGRTSHLPHVAAAAIAAMLDESDRPFVGAGLKDTTRIASGNPDLWTAILKANRTAVLGGMARLQTELDAVAAALEREDEVFLQQWLTNAKRVRDALGS